jgi:hypothetical protein
MGKSVAIHGQDLPGKHAQIFLPQATVLANANDHYPARSHGASGPRWLANGQR